MINPDAKKLVGTLCVVLVTDGILSKVVPEPLWKSDVVQLFVNIAANIVAAFATLWVMSLLRGEPTSANCVAAAPVVASRAPEHWSRSVTISVLSSFTVLAILITQQFLDAFWFHANELQRAGLLADGGLRRLGVFYGGSIPVLVCCPFITYVSLSVGRRLTVSPRYGDFLIAAVIGLGLVGCWNLVTDLAAGAVAPFWQAFPRIPGNTPTLRRFDNAVGYVLQIVLFSFFVGVYALWMKAWSYVGWWLKNRNWV